jgi:hypothetical protein
MSLALGIPLPQSWMLDFCWHSLMDWYEFVAQAPMAKVS